jgi:hypothetical protein
LKGFFAEFDWILGDGKEIVIGELRNEWSEDLFNVFLVRAEGQDDPLSGIFSDRADWN